MSYLHKYVVVPADKTLNNTGFIYMYTVSHYIDCLIIELGIDSLFGNSFKRRY